MRPPSLLVSVTIALFACAAHAAAQTAPANDVCLTCHAEPEMKRSGGTSVSIDAPAYQRSVHGPFSCVDCHTDLTKTDEFPHPETLAKVDCATCHDEPATQLTASVHVRRPQGGRSLTCAECHGPPHRMLPSSDPASPTHRTAAAATCGRCHGDGVAPTGFKGPAVARIFADSIHGQALAGGPATALTCADCHTSHRVLERTAAQSPVFRTNVPATCGTCHKDVSGDYHAGVHGAALVSGHPNAPQCASCHTAHAVSRTQSDRWQLNAVQECGTCHVQALATYRDTFHGQVTNLGFTPVAKCVDCHRPHRILKADDPQSSIHPQNLQTTCGSCHGAVTANFVKYQPHANPHDRERLPALYYASTFMHVLLIGVFAFFGIHSGLWFLRERAGSGDENPAAEGDRRG